MSEYAALDESMELGEPENEVDGGKSSNACCAESGAH